MGIRSPSHNERNARPVTGFVKNLHKLNKGQPVAYAVGFVFGIATTLTVAGRWLRAKKISPSSSPILTSNDNGVRHFYFNILNKTKVSLRGTIVNEIFEIYSM
jgi:hypothetical protein